MKTIDPHIHMSARTTDDYEAMAAAGVVAVIEPAFWLGQTRTNVGSFIDYYSSLIGWERFRAAQFGISHYCTIGLNSKEANNEALAEEVMDILPRFATKEGVVAIGEIGYDEQSAAEDKYFRAQLELAKELGATRTITPGQKDVVEQIQECTSGGVDFSLECSGLPAVLRQAIDSMNNTGTCGLIGAAPPGTECNIDMNSIMFGRTLKGVIEGDSVPDIFIPQLIDLYLQGRFPFDRLVTYYDLADIEKAVQDMEEGKVIKPVVKP